MTQTSNYESCLCYNWKSSLYLASIRKPVRLKRKSAFRKPSLIINQDTGEISNEVSSKLTVKLRKPWRSSRFTKFDSIKNCIDPSEDHLDAIRNASQQLFKDFSISLQQTMD